MPTEHLVVPRSLAGERLDRVLEELVPEFSRARLQKLVRKGHVRIDGRRVLRSNVRVPGRAALELELERGVPPDLPDLTILHEDRSLLVVVKPPGLLTHRADRSDAPSLAERLEARFGPLPRTFGEERPGIVHRLDRGTSGVLVVGRTEESMLALKRAFAAREVEKCYLALVHGVPERSELEVDEPIGPVPGKADRQQVRPPRGGKSARSTIALEEALGDHALVRCTLHTGRRHQLRVHLAARRLPVVGDPLYGTRERRPLPSGVPPPPRLALHAERLAFRHPTSGEPVAFRSPLPDDLRRTVEALRTTLPSTESPGEERR